MNEPIFQMHHISKRFGATQALDDVDLTLYPGEVHAVIGENGAGKSTLIKIMTGIYQPDQGEILLDGLTIHVPNSQAAQAHGIAAIYQEPMVFPDLNVAENIFISHRDFGPFVSWSNMFDEAEEILDTLDIHLDVRQPARGLPLAAQQAVEIAGQRVALRIGEDRSTDSVGGQHHPVGARQRVTPALDLGVVVGQVAASRSATGVFARRTQLPGPSGARPQPSRMMSAAPCMLPFPH